MSILSVPQQTALERPVVQVIYFVEFQFSGGTQRISTFNQTITWGGNDWSGFGQLVDISQVSENEGVDPNAMTFNLTARTEWLSIAIGPVEEYRGLPAKLYMGPMDESFTLVGTPVLAWNGYMDTVFIGVAGQDGSIQIKCETAAYQLKRRPTYRLNSAQHKKKYPLDTGFDYLTDLIANPQLWLSKKFQAR